jgi:excisionase family DNA binding protein
VNLLTAKDVAERLGVSALTVIRLADAGALAAVEVHRGERRRILRFRAETVEKFITTREKRGGRAEVRADEYSK